MFIHTCEICGNEFESRSNRAKYCENCRDKAQILRNKAYLEKKKSGASISLSEVSRFARFARKLIRLQLVLRNSVKTVRKSRTASGKFLQI